MIERWTPRQAPFASGLHGAAKPRVAEPPAEVGAVKGEVSKADVAPKAAMAAAAGAEAGGAGATADAGGALAPASAEPAGRKRKVSKWAPKIAWFVALVAVGGAIGMAIVTFLKFVDGPVSTTQSKTLSQLQATPKPADERQMLEGLTFQLQYPGSFDQVGRGQAVGPVLEAYNLSSKTNTQHVIAVNIRKLPDGGMTGDSSYRIRKADPAQFSERQIKFGTETAVVMTKTGGVEETLFWGHEDKLMSISITTTDPKDKVSDMMKIITDSVRWRS